MNVDKINKVIIIGSGPAGYTAAIYAARAMLEPVLIAGSQPGGQLTITTDVENFPGFADVIQGPWLMEQMKEQALKVGTKFIEDHISAVNFNKKPFEIIGDSGTHYFAESVIISTGAQARWLNLDSEEKYKGFGVSACATCDGFFYKNKDVVVVGGGNSAVEESLFLTNFAKKITLVHRKNELKAEKLLQKKLFSNPKINVIWDSVVSEIIGTENPKGVAGQIGTVANLTTLLGQCPPPASNPADVAALNYIGSLTHCEGSYTPSVQIQNNGTSPLTAAPVS